MRGFVQRIACWWMGCLAAAPSGDLHDLFGPGLSSGATITLPGPKWTSAVKQRWSTYHAPTYTGAIKPATVEDIQHIVRTAGANEIDFFATGGGHGVSNYESFVGITVDLSLFTSVRVDAATDTITVGASTQFSDLAQALYKAGRELPLASCPCVGVVGAALGAGISTLQGHRGFLLDALVSVQLVTADGRLTEVSAAEHGDLFWAIRGAGANFGIVTEATFRTYNQTNGGEATIIDLVFPAAANQSYYQTLASYDGGMPDKLALTAVALYNREINMPILVVHSIYYGPREEAERHLKPFSDLGPMIHNVVTVPQTELAPADHGSCTPNQRINIYSIALRQIHAATFEDFLEHLVGLWTRYPDYDGRLLIERYGNGAVTAVPRDSTAYPWRDAAALMNIESFYTDAAHDDAINDVALAGRNQFAKTSGYPALSAYVNFAHGDEGPEAWYGSENLQRLSALKRQWDPKGRFSWHNPIPLDWAVTEL